MSVFRLEDVSPSRLDDLVWVCSRGRSTPSHLRGVELKKAWVLEMLDRWGPVAKIAYAGGQPVGQVLYYPREHGPRHKAPGVHGPLHQVYLLPVPRAPAHGDR